MLVMVHQVSFLVVQLIILSLCGIEYSGSLAYIGAASSILAIIISLRYDIQIMVGNVQASNDILFDACITIFIMTTIIILIIALIGFPLPIHIIISAFAIATHEVFISTLFIQESLICYALFRSVPAIFLILLALLGYQPEVIWPASFLASAIILSIYFRNPLKKMIFNFNIKRIKRMNILHNLYSTFTATIFTLLTSSFVIIINFYFGDEYAGVWSNSIRIFNSLIVFILATFLPFT